MEWKTSISHVNKGKEIIRDHSLEQLMQKHSFVDVIFLILRGVLPTKQESTMLNAMLVAAIDHGIGTASAMTARIVASAKSSMNASLAASILAMGDLHGGAIEGAGKFFQEHVADTEIASLIKEYRERKMRIPGYGHAVLERDERSETLFDIAKKLKIFGAHCKFAHDVHDALQATASKSLPINIDGAMAAILSDMGFDWHMMKGVFITARVPGLVAHIYEESTSGGGLRRLEEDEIVYEGNGT